MLTICMTVHVDERQFTPLFFIIRKMSQCLLQRVYFALCPASCQIFLIALHLINLTGAEELKLLSVYSNQGMVAVLLKPYESKTPETGSS